MFFCGLKRDFVEKLKEGFRILVEKRRMEG